ncbi:MAG: SWIM zinc finger family protein [Nanoarchaeota archaeon]|nr:SWIM zinc finger family protein [Nanoarchaeota archaeon]
MYSKRIIERGEEYLNLVKYCIKINNSIFGKVEGSDIYETEVDLDSLEGNCSCPYRTNCKHAVALYLIYKKGKFADAEDFIKNLYKMSKNELIELIRLKLEKNPDWVLKHNIGKNANAGEFIKSFKKHFSSNKVEECEALLLLFSFEQLLELHDFIDRNYDSLVDKTYESEEYNNRPDVWNDEEYDAGLYELSEELKELVVKKSLEKKRIDEVIKRESLHDEIINMAEDFEKFKDKIKRSFSKEQYLKFLLFTKKPSVSEVKENIDSANKHILYTFIKEKSTFIKNIAHALNDKELIFMVAVYEKDFDAIVNNFRQFDSTIEENPDMIDKLKNIVEVFIKNNFRNEEFAKKLLSQEEDAEYNKKHLLYLVSQINDYEFIKNKFNESKIEEHQPILERLAKIDKQKTLKFITSNNNLLKGHWTNISLLFNFLRKFYEDNRVKEYLRENQEFFKTSSTLKNKLKNEGIFVSVKKGKFIVEIQ